jgi:ABC-type lipoprotein release transport system permease subunit
MMSTWLAKSIRFYAARHFVMACAIALSASIFCAALMTGHSLHEGLRRNLAKRIGDLKSALYFPEGTAGLNVINARPDTQAALFVKGELLDESGQVCANQARIIGIVPQKGLSSQTNVFLNNRARAILRGNEGSIRFKKPTGLSIELPVGDTKNSRILRRAIHIPESHTETSVSEFLITPDFALEPSTLPPINVFVPYALLATALELDGKANLFVSKHDPLSLPFSAEDYGLDIQPSTSGTVIKSKAIYLPSALKTIFSDTTATKSASFYLADSFEANGRDTPYGFVGAVTPSLCGTSPEMRDDEVVITMWLAQHLNVTTNQALLLKWRRFEPNGRLIPDERTFRISSIISTEDAANMKAYMPVFPGMKDVDSCAAWDVGMPMDEKKLKDEANEAYWKQWRETPKLFMTASAGVSCFGSVLGNAMCLQINATPDAVRTRIATSLSAQEAGAYTVQLATDGARAAAGSTDFNGLFIGMMFILIISSILLATLTLSLTLESRKHDIALLLATGWTRKRCIIPLLSEWVPTITIASLIGVLMGTELTRILIWSLARFWRSAFANASLVFHFSPSVAVASSIVMILLMLLILFIHLRRLTRQQPTTLWQTADERMVPTTRSSPRSIQVINVLGGLVALASLAILLLSVRGEHANGAFFGAGFLLLISLILFIRSLGAVWRSSHVVTCGPIETGLCRAFHMPRRNMPVILLIALGTFLVIGVLSMKNDPAADVTNPSSGSGGFASIVTSFIPFDHDKGIEMAKRVTGAKVIIPVRVHEGDTAGCLNMNAPIAPTVYGVDAQALSRFRAFEPATAGGIWSPLFLTLTNQCIPALAADLSMLHYSLKAKAHPIHGTQIPYPDRSLQIVGVVPVRSSILQGALLIDESTFLKAFPNVHGYSMWLCDYAPYLLREATDRRSRPTAIPQVDLQKLHHPEPGITVETTQERLRLLAAVESTYLDMFLVFGGLGMMLGIFGIALVIIRGVEERRHEFAVLLAIGLPHKHILLLILAEYGVLVSVGLITGLIPALVAIQPAAYALRSEMPWLLIFGVISLLLISAFASILLSSFIVSRRFSLLALKNS